MHKVCSGALFLQKEGNGFMQIKHYEPETLVFTDALESVILNAFPNYDDNGEDHYFVFTVGEQICYAYSFFGEESRYTIALLTFLNAPAVFGSFYKSCQDMFNSMQEKLHPTTKFYVIWSMASAMTYLNDNSIRVITPEGERNYKRNREMLFDGYETYRYFGKSTDYISIWKALMTNKKILVTGSDPYSLGFAVLSLISLTFPFEYKDKIFISLNTERDFHRNESFGSNVIGCLTSIADANNSIIKLKVDTKGGTAKNTSRVLQKSKLLYKLLEEIQDRNLETNPYHDLVGLNVITDDIDIQMCSEMKAKTLTFRELKQFENSNTFQSWRNGRIIRESTRGAFLSMTAEKAISIIPRELHHSARESLIELSNAFQGDQHLRSVIRKHRRILTSKLGDGLIVSSDSSESLS